MSNEILARETVYQGRAFNVRRDKVRQEDGKTASLDIVEHPGAVTILPVDADGNILFIRQYRHAIGVDLLELPAGTLGSNEEPLACARREIREETGFAAGELVKLGEFFLAPGYSTEYMHVYLATDLHHDPLPGDEDEFITLEPMPIERAYALAGNGGVVDGKSLAVLLLARSRILKSGNNPG
jgi:ADP-ribose pyrophosphatase